MVQTLWLQRSPSLAMRNAVGKMVDELRQYDFEVISTNLSAEQEQKLREAFVHV
jgi:uncharacterized membrane protein